MTMKKNQSNLTRLNFLFLNLKMVTRFLFCQRSRLIFSFSLLHVCIPSKRSCLPKYKITQLEVLRLIGRPLSHAFSLNNSYLFLIGCTNIKFFLSMQSSDIKRKIKWNQLRTIYTDHNLNLIIIFWNQRFAT